MVRWIKETEASRNNGAGKEMGLIYGYLQGVFHSCQLKSAELSNFEKHLIKRVILLDS